MKKIISIAILGSLFFAGNAVADERCGENTCSDSWDATIDVIRSDRTLSDKKSIMICLRDHKNGCFVIWEDSPAFKSCNNNFFNGDDVKYHYVKGIRRKAGSSESYITRLDIDTREQYFCSLYRNM